MRTKYYLPLLWLCLLTFGSCSTSGDDEPIPPQPEEKPQIEINASQSSPVLEQQGGTATVSFTSTAAWTADVAAATRTASWCSVSPTSGNAGEATLTITTTANETYDERRATVTLRSGTTSKSFTVSQKQKDALTVTSNKIELDATGGEAVIEVKANVAYQYDIEEPARSWISVVNTRGLTSSTLKLTVAENEELEKREGTITLRSGELSETVTVYQSGSVPTIVLTQNEYTVSSEGATIQVELRSNIDYEVQLPAEDWITEVETRAFSSHTHHFMVKPNEEYDARTAEITFINKENNVAEKVQVTQMQHDAILIAQGEYTVPAEGGRLDFSINTNVEFTVESSVEWIKQTETRGLEEKPLSFTIAENDLDENREGVITIRSGELKQEIRVVQQAKAVFTLSQKEFAVSSEGGNIQVEVTSNNEYTVQLSGDNWITEIETRGAVSHVHTFVIATNETYDARTTEILFTDKATGNVEKVTVMQAQRDAILIAQSEYTIPAEGGRLDFSVNTNVEFTVESSVEWIKQIDTRGLTEKPLSFTIVENNLDENREGLITIRSGELKQEIRVVQQAKAVFTLSQKEFAVSAEGGNIQVEVTSNNEYTVQLSGDNWITEIETRGAVAHLHTFAIATNETYDARTTEILFTDKATGNVERVTVTQAQRDAILIAQSEYTIPAEGGRLDFSVNTNVEFTVESSVPWITQIGTRGLTEKALSFTIAENNLDENREGVITLVAGDLKQVIRVVQQAKDVFSISQEEFFVGADGDHIQVEVTSNGEYTVQLPGVDWVTEVSSRGASFYMHTFQIAANTAYDGRTAEILFTDKASGVTEKVTIKQAQRDAIVVAQSEYTVPAEGGNLNFTVNTNVEFIVETSVAWITQTVTRGLTEKPLHFTVAENVSEDAREGVITLVAGELRQEIRVVQQAKVTFSIVQKEFTVGADGGNIQVEVICNGEYTMQPLADDWITEVVSDDASSHLHTFIVAANETYDIRMSYILFIDNRTGEEGWVHVIQEQRNAIIVEKNEYAFPAEGGILGITVRANVDYTVESSVDWITQVATRGLVYGSLRFMIAENTSNVLREGTIALVAGELRQELKVVQQGTANTGGGIDDLPTQQW